MSRHDPFSPRRHVLLAVLTLGVLVFGFGAWAGLSRISGAIIALGQLEVEQNPPDRAAPPMAVWSRTLRWLKARGLLRAMSCCNWMEQACNPT